MENMSELEWTEWEKKRRHSFIGYVITSIIVGLDYSFMFSTLYLYLKDVIQTTKPDFFYGLIIATYCASSTVFGAILARWVDKYRKMRLLTNIALILQVIGVTLYITPISVVYPLIGRFISGIGDPYTSVCSGEVIRIYNQKEGTSALWWLAASYSFGYLIGPVLVVFFRNVDFHIGSLRFNQYNSVGLLVAGLLVAALVIANFLVHDCSAIFDLKTYIDENGETYNIPKETYVAIDNGSCKEHIDDVSESIWLLNSSLDTKHYSGSGERKPDVSRGRLPNNDEVHSSVSSGYASINGSISANNYSTIGQPECEVEPISLVVRVLFTNMDSLLMFLSSFVFVYTLFALDVILPLLTEIVLRWSLTSLIVLFVGNAAAYFVLLMVSAKYCVTDGAVYKLLVISTIAVTLSFVIILLLTYFKHNLTLCVILMVPFECFWALGWIVEEVLIRCLLAKMVPSRCQNFAEALRNGASRLSMILATLTVPLAIPYLEKWCMGIIALTVLLLVGFLLRRQSLVLVREVNFRSHCIV